MSPPKFPFTNSRRTFLHSVGGALLVPSVSQALCEPPGTPGAAKPWRADCRPIRARRPASTLAAAEIQKLKDAYQAMRNLSVSDPNDPRGFTHQANIHCWFCSVSPTPVHGNWQFFAWHRAYLYFHERILGKLINDSEFRLPYWDWEISTHRQMPGAYTAPNNNSNPLWNGTRAMSPTDELPGEDVNEDVMEPVYSAANFGEFGGGVGYSGIPEGSPHGSVHVDVGGFAGDMGTFDTAGRDPIFYAHHANVDKIWSDWNKGASSHENPTDPAFLNLSWSFYDENKMWRSIKASQLLNHETQLRYNYGLSRFREILPCILDWIIVRPPWKLPTSNLYRITVPSESLPVHAILNGRPSPRVSMLPESLAARLGSSNGGKKGNTNRTAGLTVLALNVVRLNTAKLGSAFPRLSTALM